MILGVRPWIPVVSLFIARCAFAGGDPTRDALSQMMQSLQAPGPADPHSPDELQKLVKKRNFAAMTELGVRYWHGDGVPLDLKMARRLFYSAAIEGGDHTAINNLACMDIRAEGIEKPDLREAIDFLTQAANAGCAEAANNIGYLYSSGTGVPADPSEARRWYTKATTAGNAAAFYNLGRLLERSNSNNANDKLIVDDYTAAAMRGDPEAMLALGRIYRDGLYGVGANAKQPDAATAISWFRRAAEVGSTKGMRALAQCYADGVGVPADQRMAESWLRRAANAGDADATRDLTKLASHPK